MHATALIAEDEALLAAEMRAQLARIWPELEIVAQVGHGAAAVEAALRLRPQVLFLDIRMPGMTGLEAAQAIAEDWPDGVAAPLIVFATAYDQYAVEAFNHAAVDYLLKPIDATRLAQTCQRARAALAAQRDPNAAVAAPWDAALGQLRSLLATPTLSGRSGVDAPERLQVIQAGVGNAIHLIPVDDVVYFEAADKYVRVITARPRAPDPDRAARPVAAARPAALLADPPRHRRARRRDRRRAARRDRQADADPARTARAARREPPLRPSFQGHVRPNPPPERRTAMNTANRDDPMPTPRPHSRRAPAGASASRWASTSTRSSSCS